MKKVVFFLTAIFIIHHSNAQSNSAWSTSGWIGIGTPYPNSIFQVYGGNASLYGLTLGYGTSNAIITTDDNTKPISFQIANTEYMRLNNNGNVGIGTTAPAGRLSVLGSQQTTSFSATALNLEQQYVDFGSQNYVGASTMYRTNNGSNSWFLGGIAGVINSPGSTAGYPGGLAFYIKAADGSATSTPIEQMRLVASGNLLIGKTSQSNASYKLDVAGSVRANAVTVNTSGADFVFEPGYQLPSLTDLEKYVENNHHLPEIASAKEMQTGGLNLGENQTKLLQKVEELTLYLIEKDKQLTEQQKINKAFSAQLNHLRQQLKSINPASGKN